MCGVGGPCRTIYEVIQITIFQKIIISNKSATMYIILYSLQKVGEQFIKNLHRKLDSLLIFKKINFENSYWGLECLTYRKIEKKNISGRSGSCKSLPSILHQIFPQIELVINL